MTSFAFWKSRYEANNLSEFNQDLSGLLWLKVKSLTRKQLLSEFIEKESIDISP